jgi:acetylornithine deacetylase/succinyl-diaminopimelate desuccinylase-like protein
MDSICEQIIRIQQIPAPTFSETDRAVYIQERFETLGLVDINRDSLNNVFGRLSGENPQGRPALVISAHLDTVFPHETDLTTRLDGELLYGPGIADNSTGVAGLLILADSLSRFGLRPAADVWFVANAAEEGLGDLRGMRAVVDRFGSRALYVVVEGGFYGQLAHEAVGVRRYRIDVTALGGHSWGEFGSPSAIHVLGRLIAAIDDLSVPENPKTTYNIGVIEGGFSINTIAPWARLWLDLRSADGQALNRLVDQAQTIVRNLNRFHSERGTGVKLVSELVGNRPAGAIDRHSPIVQWADAALRHVGCDQVRYIISSTDANIPLSRGYPAVCLGLTKSGNSHRLDEYIELSHLPAGLGQLLLITLAAAGYKGA